MIRIVVDRPRYGLVEHAAALRDFLAEAGHAAELLVTPALPQAIAETGARPFALRRLFAPGVRTVVIWSVGASLAAIAPLRAAGKRVIVVVHEPGGHARKIARGDDPRYARRAALYERLAHLASLRGTPNPANAQGGLVHLPLLLAPRTPPAAPRDAVVYLGRKEPRRAIGLFRDLARRRAGGFDWVEFPDGPDCSTAAKDRVMGRAVAVMNTYRRPHNQSGVTADAIRYGVPVLVSAHDAWAGTIAAETLGAVLAPGQIRARPVLAALARIAADPGFRANQPGAADRLFGRGAFRAHWLPLFDQD